MKYFYELQIELGRRARMEFYIQQLGREKKMTTVEDHCFLINMLIQAQDRLPGLVGGGLGEKSIF